MSIYNNYEDVEACAPLQVGRQMMVLCKQDQVTIYTQRGNRYGAKDDKNCFPMAIRFLDMHFAGLTRAVDGTLSLEEVDEENDFRGIWVLEQEDVQRLRGNLKKAVPVVDLITPVKKEEKVKVRSGKRKAAAAEAGTSKKLKW